MITNLKILKYDLILMGAYPSMTFEDYQGNFIKMTTIEVIYTDIMRKKTL